MPFHPITPPPTAAAPFYAGGAAGAAGVSAGGSLTLSVIAGEALGGHRVVVLNSLGQAVYASNLDAGNASRVIGLTTGAASSGDPVNVLGMGVITEPTWAFDVALPVFLGVNGLITQVAPSSPAFALVIGFPRTSTSLFVHIRQPIFLA